MTDNDIIKALECCNDGACEYCPIGGDDCIQRSRSKAIDLINRKNAENERLQEHIKHTNNVVKQVVEDTKSEAIKEFADEFEKRCIAGGIYPAFVKKQLDDVKKEMTKKE